MMRTLHMTADTTALLVRHVLNKHDKVALIESDGAERQPGADLGE